MREHCDLLVLHIFLSGAFSTDFLGRRRGCPHYWHTRRMTLSKHQRIRAFMWRWRWIGFAALVAVFAQSVVSALDSSAPAHYRAVVAATDLPAGHQLSDSDLSVLPLPTQLPGSTVNVTDVSGHHLLVSVPKGALISTHHVLSPQTLEQASPGYVIAPVLLADTGGLSLIHTGSYVDLFKPGKESLDGSSSEAELIAHHIRVVGVAKTAGEKNFLRETPDTARFFLEIPDSTIKLILGTEARTPLIAVLSGGA